MLGVNAIFTVPPTTHPETFLELNDAPKPIQRQTDFSHDILIVNCQATGTGTWDLGPGTWDFGRGTLDLGPGTWLGTWDVGNGNREYPQSQEMTVKSHRPPPPTTT